MMVWWAGARTMCVGGMQRCAYLSDLTMRNIDEWCWRGPGTGQWLKTSSSSPPALLLHCLPLAHLLASRCISYLKHGHMTVCVQYMNQSMPGVRGCGYDSAKERLWPLECWLQTSSRRWPGHRISPAKCVQLCVRMCAISPDTGVIFIALLSTSADKQQEAWAGILTEKLLSGLQFTVAPCQY